MPFLHVNVDKPQYRAKTFRELTSYFRTEDLRGWLGGGAGLPNNSVRIPPNYQDAAQGRERARARDTTFGGGNHYNASS